MSRLFAALCALALAAPVMLVPESSGAVDRTLPMRFDLRVEGPSRDCGEKCRIFVFANGAITAETPNDFKRFARSRELAGALVVLDSDGGSVHGAIALGREIRRLGMDTTVGQVADIGEAGKAGQIGKFVPRADCESMCAFVLLAGVHRFVPPQARVMVHQIWLGDRRDDPTAANYSAEDLVLVQRDIGKLAQYTVEMGASIEVLDLALRIPPWEPMRQLTQEEILRARVATDEIDAAAAATVALSPPATKIPAKATARPLPTPISERHWGMVEHSGSTALARSHPLTVEGEQIGSFDLMVACGSERGSYDVSYYERRYTSDRRQTLGPLQTVKLRVGYDEAALKIVSSERRTRPDELVTRAVGKVPAALIEAYAAAGNRSLNVATGNAQLSTGIRIGNTGAQQNLPRLVASCTKPLGDRADLSLSRTGGLAAK